MKPPVKSLLLAERASFIGHVGAMAFGLAGLLLVLPNPDFVATLPPAGVALFQWGMSQGGVGYILLGAAAISLYLCRTLGVKTWLAFFLPAVGLSLTSELVGTSTGFPFGPYHYLTGLGYKVAGLVPFTIPLSWFYMGATCYVLALVGLRSLGASFWVRQIGSIALGSVLLMAWDLALDPAMSQSPFPFWEFEEAGAFFGMPYRNLSGWVATGAVFMTVAALFWRGRDIRLTRGQLTLPVVTYLVNYLFGAAITGVLLDHRYLIPVGLGVALGVVPVLFLWAIAPTSIADTSLASEAEPGDVEPGEEPIVVPSLAAK